MQWFKKYISLWICFCNFGFSFVFTKNACFLCAMCGNTTAFYSISLEKIVQKTLWKIHLCCQFINLLMGNNWPHKSGTNSTLYNLAMKGFLFLSHIFIWTYSVCFAVTKCPSETSIYSSVSTYYPGIKSEISGVMWQVAPQAETKLVNCKLSPNLF